MLILASSSPRRRHLLTEAGIAHVVCAPRAAEDPEPGETPEALVRRCARAKAESVADRRPEGLVLAADTVVSLDGGILGKPGSPAGVRDMLRALSGRTHEVLSGIVLLRREPPFLREALVVSHVTFRSLEAEEIERYVASGEGCDKAGGYGIQGLGGALVARYSGCYSNIVGLPMTTTQRLLAEADANP